MTRGGAARKKIYGNLAISQAIEEEMLRDDKVVLIGHDQGRYGGSFGVTRRFMTGLAASVCLICLFPKADSPALP